MADMSPAAWLELLDKRLTERWTRMQRLEDYYNGQHPLTFATARYREAFGSLLATMADNWCRIVVSSSVERLNVQGFRFGAERTADDDAWAIWQANGLDAKANMLHTEAIKLGEAYWIVEPPSRGSDVPRIAYEHPSQMIVATAPSDPDQRLAALKRWVDDDGYAYANLYLPRAIFKWRSQRPLQENGGWTGGKIDWQRRTDDPGGTNPLGVVPVVPLRNAPSMLGGGSSDIEPGIPLQDAINKLCADMMVAAEFAAYRQRVMTGVEQAKYPEGHALAGQPIPIELSVTRLFTVEAADAKVFDLEASDLNNYVQAIEMLVQHFAAQVKVPPHYLLGKMVNISGDALTAAESGQNSKVEDKKLSFGEGHEEAMRLAFLAIGDTDRAQATDAETLWAPSERRSYAQTVDGAAKLAAIPGMPLDAVFEELGWSPQRIARVKAMQLVDEFLTPPPAPTEDNGATVTPSD